MLIISWRLSKKGRQCAGLRKTCRQKRTSQRFSTWLVMLLMVGVLNHGNSFLVPNKQKIEALSEALKKKYPEVTYEFGTYFVDAPVVVAAA